MRRPASAFEIMFYVYAAVCVVGTVVGVTVLVLMAP